MQLDPVTNINRIVEDLRSQGINPTLENRIKLVIEEVKDCSLVAHISLNEALVRLSTQLRVTKGGESLQVLQTKVDQLFGSAYTLKQLPKDLKRKCFESDLATIHSMATVDKSFHDVSQSLYIDSLNKNHQPVSSLRLSNRNLKLLLQKVGHELKFFKAGDLDKETALELLKLCPDLEAISLTDLSITDQDFADIVSSPNFHAVNMLDLCHHTLSTTRVKLTDASITALINSPYRQSLIKLNVSNSLIGAPGIIALASSNIQLHSLILEECLIGDDGIIVLVSSPNSSKLKELNLYKCGITDRGAIAVINLLPLLESIDLGANRLGSPTIDALANYPQNTRLTKLSLKNIKNITTAECRKLANSPYLANLTVFWISHTSIGEEGILAIANSPYMTKLRELQVSQDETISAEVGEVLESIPHLQNCSIEINLEHSEDSDSEDYSDAYYDVEDVPSDS